jgi:tungstate transport system ATP-binding protein
MNPLLSFKSITFHRDDFTLQIDHLELCRGEVYLLCGPNGSGKSTLLHLLALLLAPAGGTIHYDGIAVNGAAERQRLRRQITLVEQHPFLFNASVYQNLAFGLRLREVHGELQRKRIANALQTVGLEGFERRRASALSGGEMRRVALARAMVLRPQLLLLDEPTAGLDRESLPIFERCLAALPGQGTTVVIASHDTDQQRRLDANVLCLERGRLVSATTSPPAMWKEYA